MQRAEASAQRSFHDEFAVVFHPGAARDLFEPNPIGRDQVRIKGRRTSPSEQVGSGKPLVGLDLAQMRDPRLLFCCLDLERGRQFRRIFES